MVKLLVLSAQINCGVAQGSRSAVNRLAYARIMIGKTLGPAMAAALAGNGRCSFKNFYITTFKIPSEPDALEEAKWRACVQEGSGGIARLDSRFRRNPLGGFDIIINYPQSTYRHAEMVIYCHDKIPMTAEQHIH